LDESGLAVYEEMFKVKVTEIHRTIVTGKLKIFQTRVRVGTEASQRLPSSPLKFLRAENYVTNDLCKT
jgi:hypothetical protein